MITVVGIFEDERLAEEAGSYLLANEFTNENIDIHTHGNHTDDYGPGKRFFQPPAG
jgi:hypothetical protein